MSGCSPLPLGLRAPAVVLAMALSALLVLGPAAPSRAAVADDTLVAGETLTAGQQVDIGPYRLVMQPDGNAVVYSLDGRVRWHAGTWGNTGARLVMQGDGNLVVYAVDGRVLWNSVTYGSPGARTVLQSDGNLVVYQADGRPLWNIGADVAVGAQASDLFAIRPGVPSGTCGDADGFARSMAAAGAIWHGGDGWNGQIVAIAQDAPGLVQAWRSSPPHVAVAAGPWSRMAAGAARGADGRLYGVVNFCR